MIAVSTKLNDGIGWLWLDNPKRYNALNLASWKAISTCLEELIEAEARVIVVAGKEENFCAGADISEFDMVRHDAKSAAHYEKANAEAFAAIANVPVPTIAAIDGFCLGGGFGIAAACDIRIGTESSSFAVPAARLGLAYPVAAMRDIVAAVGEQNAKLLLFTAKRFTAHDMMNMGFLSQVDSDVLHRAKDMATEIGSLAPLTHRATKSAIKSISKGDANAAEQLGNLTFTSEDYAEGRTAFKQKRAAQFKGR